MALTSLAKGFITPGISSAFGGGATQKGYIEPNNKTIAKIDFQYNPEKVSETVASVTQDIPIGKGTNKKTFHIGGSTHSYNFELWFDTYETISKESVKTKYVDPLMKLMLIDKDTLKADKWAQKGSPGSCKFFFGSHWTPDGFITKCSASYTMFHNDFTPARAKVTIEFTEAATVTSVSMQNPTSAGQGGESSYVVQPGDTLEGIAYREFGSPTQWRAIAQANGIENPLDLKPGRRLAIPPL
jgi:hypothetical protein